MFSSIKPKVRKDRPLQKELSSNRPKGGPHGLVPGAAWALPEAPASYFGLVELILRVNNAYLPGEGAWPITKGHPSFRAGHCTRLP